MKWLVVVSIAALSVLAATSTAAADEGKGFTCNGVFSGGTIKNGDRSGQRRLHAPGVDRYGQRDRGRRRVLRGVWDYDSGQRQRQGCLDDLHPRWLYHRRQCENQRSTQLFLFDGSVGGSVQAGSSVENFGHVQVCGMTISKKVQIQKGGTDILVGDSLAGCGGNTIGGDLRSRTTSLMWSSTCATTRSAGASSCRRTRGRLTSSWSTTPAGRSSSVTTTSRHSSGHRTAALPP